MSTDITCVADVPRHHAAVRAGETALWFEGRATTYGELDRLASQCAQALIAAGVAPGERVGVLAKGSDAFFILWLGCLKARACLTPVNWRLAPPEIAFILKDALVGPGVTAEQVIAATDAIAPCFEIVDSRIDEWKISIVDTVADNASCGVYVLGDERLDPAALDLPGLHVAVTKNGAPLSEGFGHAVQGNPAEAVAWLANTLGAHGVTLDVGDVILSGSLVPLAPAVKGDRFEMILSDAGQPIGRCAANFI